MMFMLCRARLLCAVLAVLVVTACGSEDTGVASQDFTMEVGPFELAPGEETDTICYSYTLNNEETVYVRAVEMNAGLGVHHSNWLFVPDDVYPGPDGAWTCADRGFDTAISAVVGGVLFAQSTQAVHEVQEFEPGAVIALPPGSRIVGNLHLLNASDQALQVSTTLDVRTATADEARVRLAPMYLQYLPLSIEPMQQSRFTTTCDYESAHQDELGRPLDIKIHYVLPHYHGYGRGVRVEAAGGARDGEVIFENESQAGEAWGRRLDPPFDLTGATGLRFSCLYDNPTERTVRWGIGDDEMCIVVGFVESELIWGGGVMDAEDSAVTGVVGDVVEHEGACTLLYTPLRSE